MARAQTWTRNISKKVNKVTGPDLSRSIVNDDAVEAIKRRAEKLGLIVHGQPPRRAGKKGNK